MSQYGGLLFPARDSGHPLGQQYCHCFLSSQVCSYITQEDAPLYIDKLKHHFGRSIGPPPRDVSSFLVYTSFFPMYRRETHRKVPCYARLGRPCSAVYTKAAPHCMAGVFPPISYVNIKKKVISVKFFVFNHFLLVLE